MMTFRCSTLRRGLTLSAALLLPGLASAQSLRIAPAAEGLTPVPQAATSRQLAAGSASAGDGLLAACTNASSVLQNSGTNAYAQGNTATTTGTAQELGQSFTSPCDGFIDTIGINFAPQNAATANTAVSGTLYIYNGAGTSATPVSASRFTVTLPASGFFATYYLSLDVIPVTTNGIYTFFADMDAGSNALIVGSPNGTATGANPYAGGAAYLSTSGSPTPTSAIATLDLRFEAYFSPSATVTTPTVYNGAGWRLLSTPVFGVTVNDLAQQNLVQRVAAGTPASLYPAQYTQAPGTQSNLLTTYNGNGTFAGPGTTGQLVFPGNGFFWYWYDRAIPANAGGPYGGGTSSSRELTGYTLTATGSDFASNITAGFATSTDGFYMLGNPFRAPFLLSGVTQTAGGGTLGTVFSVWDPSALSGAGSYRSLGPTDYVAPWQGFFLQNTGATNPTFSYALASTSATATPAFYGRGASVANVGIAFELEGTTADGPVGDLASEVRFVSDAELGRDRHDGSKLLPPGGPYALLAPVADLDGIATRLAMNSLPEPLTGAVTVPLQFVATSAGTFTLTWTNTLAGGRKAALRDLVTGATVDLATTTEYTFASDATNWTPRFELVLGRGAVAGEAAPAAVRVGTFAPNPAAGLSRLTFTADAAQTVRAAVVDALGREVVVLFNGAVTAGTETALSVEAGRLAPGTYAVRIAGETFAETRRLTVVR